MWKLPKLFSTKKNRECKAKVIGTVEIFDKKEMKGMTPEQKRAFLKQASDRVAQLRAKFTPEQVAAIRKKTRACR